MAGLLDGRCLQGEQSALIALRGVRSLRPTLPRPLWIATSGTGQTNLTSTKTIIEDEPSWSPDGKQIAFTRADAGDFFVDQDVYVMNVDGTGRTRLANNASSPSFAPRDR